jgi:hypothetical protein
MMTADGRQPVDGANCVPSAGGVAGEAGSRRHMVESPRVWEAMGEGNDAPAARPASWRLDAAEARVATGAGEAERGSSSSRQRASAGSGSSTSGSKTATPRSSSCAASSNARSAIARPIGRPETAPSSRGSSLPELYVLQCTLYDAVEEANRTTR